MATLALRATHTPTYRIRTRSVSPPSSPPPSKSDSENDPKLAPQTNRRSPRVSNPSSVSYVKAFTISPSPSSSRPKRRASSSSSASPSTTTLTATQAPSQSPPPPTKGDELPEVMEGLKSVWVDIEPVKPYTPSVLSPSRPGLIYSPGRRQIQLGPRETISWFEIVGLSITRLRQKTGRTSFHHKNEICELIDKSWEDLCRGHERTSTWWKTVLATITTNREIFVAENPGTGFWSVREAHVRTFELLNESLTTGIVPDNIQILEVPLKSPSTRGSSGGTSNNKRKRGKGKDVGLLEGSSFSSPLHKRQRTKSPEIEGSLSHKQGARRHSLCSEEEQPRYLRHRACHNCKQQREMVTLCTECTSKYCEACLAKYNEKLDKTIAKKKWSCPKCRDICVCALCKRTRGSAPSARQSQRRRSLETSGEEEDYPKDEEEEDNEGGEEEFKTRIMASVMRDNGEREYCVRWYSKETGVFTTTWETRESINARTEQGAETRDLKIHIRNINSYDLQPSSSSSFGPSSTSSSPSLANNRRKRASDFDIERVICNAFLPCRAIVPLPKPEHIWVPTFRALVEEEEEGEEKEEEDGGEEEDISDEAFRARHQKAGEVLRKERETMALRLSTSSTSKSGREDEN